MKCPRCKTKTNLGENDMFCIQCGLDLMQYFMKGDFDTVENNKMDEAAGEEEDSEKAVQKEDRQDCETEERNSEEDALEEAKAPYCSFGEDIYDPYRNMTGKKEDVLEFTEKTDEPEYDKNPYNMKKTLEQKIQESEKLKKESEEIS